MPGFYHDLPKAELHVHLEGSVEPETLGLRRGYRFADFAGFLEAFGRVVKALRTPEDYALVTRRLLARLEEQNVRYAEIILSAGVVLWKEQEFGPVFDAVRAAAEGSKVEVRWILDAVRHFGVEHCRKVAELAAERVGQGVVAYGIGGNEERGPAAWFGEVFRFAKEAGLHLTAHAGEACGPESVWAALELGAERIGHGISAIRDPVLVRHLRDRDIPLEISITSNRGDGRGGADRGAPGAAALRCGGADRAEHGRPGDVRHHADRGVRAGGAAVRVHGGGDAGGGGERVPVRVRA